MASATLRPTTAPHVPEGLLWYPHERFWQGLAKMRLESGLMTYSLEIDYDDDCGVNAKASAKLMDAGFDIGGTYNNFESTKWIMQGTFAHPDKQQSESGTV